MDQQTRPTTPERLLPPTTPAVTIDDTGLTIGHGDHRVELSTREFALASALATRAGRVVGFDSLIRAVWDGDAGRRRLQVLVSRLRRRLAPLGLTVTAIPKRGYRLDLV